MNKIFRMTFLTTALSLLYSAAFAKPASIDSVCASLASRNVTTGNFQQEKIVSQRNLKSTGTFVLSKTGIAFITEKPIKSTQSISPSSVVTITADGSRTVLDTSDNTIFQGITQVVSSLFEGDKSKLEKNFSTSISAGEKEWTIKLLPKDQNIAAMVKDITLGGTGNSESSELKSMTLVLNNGLTVRYTFSELKYKSTLSESEKALF
ncbi:MAG: outer membrane lipoprotein carrier protein LolA [Treponema sp.]|nr:outer membrane lipoprotein carrier protein LolA [Treponema sp.]